MLVICALALVVAAAFFLVIGLAAGDVGDLYLSMVLCVVSLVVVAVSSRVSRTRPAVDSGHAPEPMEPEGDQVEEAKEPAMAGAPARRSRADGDEGLWAPGDVAPSAGRAAPRPAVMVEAPPAPVAATLDVTDDESPAADLTGGPVTFPIADYDSLEAAQILPLVPELWPEEVPLVADRERAVRARPAVLDALVAAARDPRLAFPIAEYESLDTEQVTRLLARLDADDLATVQVAERAGGARVGILVAVADHLAARR